MDAADAWRRAREKRFLDDHSLSDAGLSNKRPRLQDQADIRTTIGGVSTTAGEASKTNTTIPRQKEAILILSDDDDSDEDMNIARSTLTSSREPRSQPSSPCGGAREVKTHIKMSPGTRLGASSNPAPSLESTETPLLCRPHRTTLPTQRISPSNKRHHSTDRVLSINHPQPIEARPAVQRGPLFQESDDDDSEPDLVFPDASLSGSRDGPAHKSGSTFIKHEQFLEKTAEEGGLHESTSNRVPPKPYIARTSGLGDSIMHTTLKSSSLGKHQSPRQSSMQRDHPHKHALHVRNSVRLDHSHTADHTALDTTITPSSALKSSITPAIFTKPSRKAHPPVNILGDLLAQVRKGQSFFDKQTPAHKPVITSLIPPKTQVAQSLSEQLVPEANVNDLEQQRQQRIKEKLDRNHRNRDAEDHAKARPETQSDTQHASLDKTNSTTAGPGHSIFKTHEKKTLLAPVTEDQVLPDNALNARYEPALPDTAFEQSLFVHQNSPSPEHNTNAQPFSLNSTQGQQAILNTPNIHSTSGTSKRKPHDRKLGRISCFDVKLATMLQQGVASSDLVDEHERLFHEKRAPGTVRRRCRKVIDAMAKAKIDSRLIVEVLQQIPGAEDELNRLVEQSEALAVSASLDRAASQQEEHRHNLQPTIARTADMLSKTSVMSETTTDQRMDDRPSTGGKQPSWTWISDQFANLWKTESDEDDEGSVIASSESIQDPEGYNHFEYQVQRRECLTSAGDNKDIEDCQWFDVEEPYVKRIQANAAATGKVLLLRFGSHPVVGNDSSFETKHDTINGLVHSRYLSATGTVQTRVIQRTRIFSEQMPVADKSTWVSRTLYHVKQRVTKKDAVFGDNESIVESFVDECTSADPAWANMKAIEHFVENTYSSKVANLQLRDLEKAEERQKYTDELVNGNLFSKFRETVKGLVEVWVETGRLMGPRNL